MANSKRNESDFFTKKAKEKGYPARSVFKLEEIQEKFHIIPLKTSSTILDVGAAPGSWSLYISKEILKGEGKLISIDLNPLLLNPKPSNIIEITGDAFSEQNIQKLSLYAPFDAIVSDAAPKTTGQKSSDAARSEELVRALIENMIPLLKTNGSFVCKIYEGEGRKELQNLIKGKFKKISLFKPVASRCDSVEIFMIGQNKIN